jgi:hypothetical protein
MHENGRYDKPMSRTVQIGMFFFCIEIRGECEVDIPPKISVQPPRRRCNKQSLTAENVAIHNHGSYVAE